MTEPPREPSALAVRRKWILTSSALEKLLRVLGEDRDQAGRSYETIRAGLVRFFRGRGSEEPESLADETIDRVCRRLEEGQPFDGGASYFYGVARNVLREHVRRARRLERIRMLLARQDTAAATAWPDLLGRSDDEKMTCLGSCLSELSAVDRLLVQQYYGPDDDGERASPAARAEVARRMGISPINLRQRAYRVRHRLQECFWRCLARRGRS